MYSSLIYLWLFGILETCVVLAFRAKLNLGHPLAWLYLAVLAVNDLAALVGVLDWLSIRPRGERFGPANNWLLTSLEILFILFVGFLATYGLFAKAGGSAPMEAFSRRSCPFSRCGVSRFFTWR